MRVVPDQISLARCLYLIRRVDDRGPERLNRFAGALVSVRQKVLC